MPKGTQHSTLFKANVALEALRGPLRGVESASMLAARMLHISIEPATGEITAERLSDNGKHDAAQVEAVIYRFKRLIARVLRWREMPQSCTEARLGRQILNRLLGLGMPACYTIEAN